MDIYDYDEDHFSTVAVNCRYLSYKQMKKPEGTSSGVSCRDCKSWNGSGCSRNQYDNIASDLQLD